MPDKKVKFRLATELKNGPRDTMWPANELEQIDIADIDSELNMERYLTKSSYVLNSYTHDYRLRSPLGLN